MGVGVGVGVGPVGRDAARACVRWHDQAQAITLCHVVAHGCGRDVDFVVVHDLVRGHRARGIDVLFYDNAQNGSLSVADFDVG